LKIYKNVFISTTATDLLRKCFSVCAS